MPDGYFGNIGNSFYAGPNGASFQIKAEFGNYRELLANSDNSILIGDYLIVNYGSQATPTEATGPNNKSYNTNKAIDAYNGTGVDPETESGVAILQNPGYYNATLWQKVNTGDSPALNYELVFQSVSVAPDIIIATSTLPIAPGASIGPDGESIISKDETTTGSDLQRFTMRAINAWKVEKGQGYGENASDFIGAGTTPSITFDRKTVPTSTLVSEDTVYVHFGIPKAWDLELGDATPNPAGVGPTISITASTINPSTHKAISIHAPNSWDVQTGSTVNAYPRTGAVVSIDKKSTPDASDSNTTKYLHFGLPNAWDLDTQVNYIGTQSLPSAEIKSITVTTNPHFNTHRILELSLPQTAVFNNPAVKAIDPEPINDTLININQTWIDNHTLHLDFNLPRGARIYCGTMLDQYGRTPQTAPITVTNSAFSTLLRGDIYVSPKYSTIWKVTSVTKNGNQWQSCTLEEQGIAQVFANLSSRAISPQYDNGIPSAIPTVTYDYSVDPPRATIDIFQAPKIASNVGIVSSEAENQGMSVIASGETITFNARVPRGPAITSGDLTKFNRNDYPQAKGDYFLRSDTYKLYRFTADSDKSTVEEIANLKGENIDFKGDPVTVDNSDLSGYTGDLITQIALYLKNNLPESEKPYPDREIKVVIYEEKDTSDPPEVIRTITYWFYRRVNELEEETYDGFQVSDIAGGSIIFPTDDAHNPGIVDSVTNGTQMVFSANSILQLKSSLTATIATKAPIVHAVSTTIYGAGNATNYGHVMLTDTYTIPSDTTTGKAITSKGVYDALTWGSWEISNNTYSIKKGSVTIETGSITV